MKRFNIKIDEIKIKKKLFVYIKVAKLSEDINEQDVREKLIDLGHDVGELRAANKIENGKGLFVFDIGDGIIKKESLREEAIKNFKPEELKQEDLTLSHAGSDPELAPVEVTDPEPKTTRTRKPSTRTRKPRAKKTPTNNT
tara:strand:- start:257 stop:679 length:423 start_codon:yes stop_codon:yes gene_type:complete